MPRNKFCARRFTSRPAFVISSVLMTPVQIDVAASTLDLIADSTDKAIDAVRFD
jgi:hypothetical protein